MGGFVFAMLIVLIYLYTMYTFILYIVNNMHIVGTHSELIA